MTFKKLMLLGIAIAMFTGSTLTASAANLKDIFDANYYAEKYPDLKAAYGNNAESLYQHFLKYGVKEGRNMSPILDVAAYRKAYPDLDKAFGDNWDAYVNHFVNFGIYEKRSEGVLMNPLEYADAYEDVSTTCGNDVMAIIRHYKQFGIKEKRNLGTAEGYSSIAQLDAARTKEDPKELPRSYTLGDGYVLLTYNAEGKVILEEVFLPDDYHTREWDRYGRLIRETYTTPDLVLVAETINTYYPNGKLASSKGQDFDKIKFERTYDQQGNLLTELLYD